LQVQTSWIPFFLVLHVTTEIQVAFQAPRFLFSYIDCLLLRSFRVTLLRQIVPKCAQNVTIALYPDYVVPPSLLKSAKESATSITRLLVHWVFVRPFMAFHHHRYRVMTFLGPVAAAK
jgi:hypothetical protein